MTFVDGTTTDLTVADLFERQDVMGNMIMTSADWAPHAGQAMDVVVFVTFADGVTEEAGQAAVTAVTEHFGAPDPQTRDEYMASMGEQIDQMLYVIYGLLGIAVLIAVMGIGNTLSLSIHERTRELGLLRAVGQSRGAAALVAALGVGDRRRVRHRRRPRPRHVPRLGPDAGDERAGGLRHVRRCPSCRWP